MPTSQAHSILKSKSRISFSSRFELLSFHTAWVKNGSVRARAARPFYPRRRHRQPDPACPFGATTGHAVGSIGSDIIRPLEQWEYQDRLHRSRPHVHELEAVPDCEPSQAGRTETAPSPRGMRASRVSGAAPAKACARLSTSKRIVGLIVESRWANWLLCTRTGNCHSSWCVAD